MSKSSPKQLSSSDQEGNCSRFFTGKKLGIVCQGSVQDIVSRRQLLLHNIPTPLISESQCSSNYHVQVPCTSPNSVRSPNRFLIKGNEMIARAATKKINSLGCFTVHVHVWKLHHINNYNIIYCDYEQTFSLMRTGEEERATKVAPCTLWGLGRLVRGSLVKMHVK